MDQNVLMAVYRLFHFNLESSENPNSSIGIHKVHHASFVEFFLILKINLFESLYSTFRMAFVKKKKQSVRNMGTAHINLIEFKTKITFQPICHIYYHK